MKCRLFRALALLLPLAAAVGSGTVAAAQPSFAQALARALPLTLGVYGVRDGVDESEGAASAPHAVMADRRRPIRVGAGFLINVNGLAVTAAHVVTGATRVAVQLSDERVLAAEVLATDEVADVALIRLPLKLAVPPPIGRGASLRPGDWVLAVGEPYGLARSVTAGIVGGRQRHFADEPEMLYIQSDLALNPGSSGGPLLDSEGTIVGMNVRAAVGEYGASGISLSLPIELVLQIARELQDGTIERPRLSAEFHDL
ncbi:MAG TPA: trypsin-like peptidase domain-containing protein, partial [Burkholderiaceae bacterium]|nr:trypsin-like peptidase domain-containing protein [Burkholderiaceae bacterium]